MNREIKFRVWGKSNRMIPWSELCRLHASMIFQKADGYHVMQFTGLKDKEKNEWYEGDIIENDGQQYQIIWDNQNTMFYADNINPDGEGLALSELHTADTFLIGNIYENEDLLK